MRVLMAMGAVALMLVGALLAFAATRPDAFRVEREVVIAAPAEKVYALIEDFRAWPSWSPWEKLDPGMKRTYEGPARGAGAVYAWDGDRNVGAGRMEITEAAPPSRIALKLDFSRPFEGHNVAVFTLEPRGDATRVTWSMTGPSRFIAKVIQTVVSMDRMVGNNFETGLANLKAVAER